MNVSGFFAKKGKSVIFTGDKLEIIIPARYGIHGFLAIESTVKTIGIFDMVINGKIHTGYKLGAIIEITPSEITTITKGTEQFIKLTLNKGDLFLTDTKYVELNRIGYVMFYEMANSGNYPDFISYMDTMTIYDNISKVVGLRFDSNHAVIEIINSQLFRSRNDVTTLYRHTNMAAAPMKLGLNAIAQVATSVIGKISGAYARQGIESAIADGGSQSDIGDILRS